MFTSNGSLAFDTMGSHKFSELSRTHTSPPSNDAKRLVVLSARFLPLLAFVSKSGQEHTHRVSAIQDKLERELSNRLMTEEDQLRRRGGELFFNRCGWEKVRLCDVMCDKNDPMCDNHFGNRRLALVVCVYLSYQDPTLKKSRQQVAEEIVDMIRYGHTEHQGRFLEKTSRGEWKEISVYNRTVQWVRGVLKQVDLTDRERAHAVEPGYGTIDDFDVAWLNGNEGEEWFRQVLEEEEEEEGT